MPTLDEIFSAKTSAAADAATGVQVLSQSQEMTFDKYVRVILPSDGYVFWVRADLLSESALLNATVLNRVPLNLAPRVTSSENNTLTVQGSFHWDANSRQEEAQNYTATQVVFTALSEVEDLRTIAPGVSYICRYDGMTFAFNSQGYFYKQVDLYHYRGMAVYSDLLTQVVDSMGLVDLGSQVVSNSLPIWLSMNTYRALYGITASGVSLYPSMLVPDNLRPPYGAVHVIPESTTPVASAPRLGRTLSHSQLVQERVRVTFSGVRHSEAMDFLDFVGQFTLDTDSLGLMNSPVVADQRSRAQSELNIIAQRKVMEFQVNYYQNRSRDVARQLIRSAIPSYILPQLNGN